MFDGLIEHSVDKLKHFSCTKCTKCIIDSNKSLSLLRHTYFQKYVRCIKDKSSILNKIVFHNCLFYYTEQVRSLSKLNSIFYNEFQNLP